MRGKADIREREAILADGLKVQLVSRRHAVDGRPTMIRVAYSEEPLWQQFRVRPGRAASPVAADSCFDRHWRLFPGLEVPAADSQMARKAEEITSDRLHERLPVNAADGELADLSRVFNAVLVRLEQSFEQLRRFTSDASHELRTPLAAMRSVGEVGLQRNDAPKDTGM